jgi:hypothetical protein
VVEEEHQEDVVVSALVVEEVRVEELEVEVVDFPVVRLEVEEASAVVAVDRGTMSLLSFCKSQGRFGFVRHRSWKGLPAGFQ